MGVPVAQQISEEHEDDELCVVCWDRPREVIFLGCGHMVRALLCHLLFLLTKCGGDLSCADPDAAVLCTHMLR